MRLASLRNYQASLIRLAPSPDSQTIPGFAVDLFDGPRACDQNIHQSPGALLPVGTGRDIRHSDQSAKQINRVEVFTYIAAFDGALHQSANRFPDLIVRSASNTFLEPAR